MDVVVQFAIHRLGFQPQDIIIYAWSIGGFTGTNLPPASPLPICATPTLPQGEVGKCTGGPAVGSRLKGGEDGGGISAWVWKMVSYLYTFTFLLLLCPFFCFKILFI